MSPQSNLVAEAPARDHAGGPGVGLARVLSTLFHPISVGIATMALVGWYGDPDVGSGLRWALICALVQILPVAGFFLVRLRMGAYSDEDVSDRRQRNELYLFGMVSLVVGITILWLVGVPRPFLDLMLVGGLINGLSWLINLSWKISVHSASMGIFATVAALYSQRLGLALWACALAVGWARVRTRNHTPLQVSAGLALAALVVLLVFGLGH